MVNYGRINAVLTPRGVAGGQLNPKKNLRGVVQPSMSSGGTNDYNQLTNHPSINTHELVDALTKNMICTVRKALTITLLIAHYG